MAKSTGLMHPISLVGSLETGKVKLSDKVDTGNGIIKFKAENSKDHTGIEVDMVSFTVQEGFLVVPNIAIYKTMEKAFAIILKPF